MQKGDIVLVRNTGWLSTAIRYLTKGYYNHTGMFISSDEIIEATFKKVEINALSILIDMSVTNKCEFSVYRPINLTQEQIDIMVDFAEAQVGDKYDFVQLICIGLFILFHIGRKHQPLDARKAWICTELIGEAFLAAGIKLDDKIDPDALSPAEIANSKHLQRIL